MYILRYMFKIAGKVHGGCRLSSLFHLSEYYDMEYVGEITDERQHEHQIKGYLLYKTITSQKVSSGNKIMFCSQAI